METVNPRLAALAANLKCSPDDLKVSKYDEKTIEHNKEEYLVVTDSEADDLWDEDLENYIDDCLLPELKSSGVQETISRYFDREAFKRDARMDGRAHSLSRYDGTEESQTIDGTEYYIYRQN